MPKTDTGILDLLISRSISNYCEGQEQ